MHLCTIGRPAKEARRARSLPYVPARAELDRPAIHDVLEQRDEVTPRVDGVATPSRVDAKLVLRAVRHVLVQGRVDGDGGLDVVTVDTVQVAGLEPA